MRLSFTRVTFLVSAAGLAITLAACQGPSQQAVQREPISYIGHGAFFDHDGKEIAATPEFIAETQQWYRQNLAERLSEEDQRLLPGLEKKLRDGIKGEGLETLAINQAVLTWMVARLPKDKVLVRVPGKLRLLERRVGELTAKRLNPELLEKLQALDFEPKPGGMVFLATINSGQAYIDECAAANVPIPPSINRMSPAFSPGWTSRGFIPRAQQFIVGSPAEVRTFENADGVCVALPRYAETDNNPATNETATAELDGVICLSKVTAKTCFWDNTNLSNPAGYNIPASTIVPIGVATSPGGLYQGGGAEIEFAAGGVCTDCHAGENPYIVHPDADLGGGVLMGNLNWQSPQKYVPLVGASWPQNLFSQSFATVPPGCKSCHTQSGAGRIPHLYLSEDPFDPNDPTDTFSSNTWDRNGLLGYCNSVLRRAVAGAPRRISGITPAQTITPTLTMPQFSPGTMAADAGLNTMRAFCQQPLSAGPSDRGDPHLITTDGTAYDFQAAGEFTALRNSASGFELQTRQTPVTTTFTPGANAYTGLASCVSLNTAVAVRLGRRRISYQSPLGADPSEMREMELRIDGRLTALPAGGIDLGDGRRIDPIASGAGINLTEADGTKVAVTSNFWSSQGYWYLDVNVGHTPAREGTMGTILPGNWLPLAPDGNSFGPKPAALLDRHALLNQKFADAWRVGQQTSLFDYSPGTSTLTYTDLGWPSAPGGSCMSTSARGPETGGPLKSGKIEYETALRYCRRLPDKKAQMECAFDMTVMGEKAVLEGYLRSLQARAGN